jgi:hypothetical protein
VKVRFITFAGHSRDSRDGRDHVGFPEALAADKAQPHAAVGGLESLTDGRGDVGRKGRQAGQRCAEVLSTERLHDIATQGGLVGRRARADVPSALCGERGDGTMSSSDGQRFKASGKAESTGTSIPSTEANRASSSTLICLISTRPQLQVVNVSVRDSTFVLDGCSHCPS